MLSSLFVESELKRRIQGSYESCVKVEQKIENVCPFPHFFLFLKGCEPDDRGRQIRGKSSPLRSLPRSKQEANPFKNINGPSGVLQRMLFLNPAFTASQNQGNKEHPPPPPLRRGGILLARMKV